MVGFGLVLIFFAQVVTQPDEGSVTVSVKVFTGFDTSKLEEFPNVKLLSFFQLYRALVLDGVTTAFNDRGIEPQMINRLVGELTVTANGSSTSIATVLLV